MMTAIVWRRLRPRRLLQVVIAVLLSSVPVLAQKFDVTGTISDTAGRPVRGATVAAENAASVPSSVATTTDADGRYRLRGLNLGSWRVVAVAQGFDVPP